MSDLSKSRKQPKSCSSSLSPSPLTPKALTLTLSRMARRSFLKTFRLVSNLSLHTLYSFLQASPSIPSLSSSSSSSFTAAVGRPPATKIYVYDLPSKFTYDVIRNYDLARNPRATMTPDDALRYPGHQHSAEWYLFSDLLRPDRRPYSPVHRVSDPEEADLFHVIPFFSSLSLIVNPIRAANTDTDSKKAYGLTGRARHGLSRAVPGTA